MTDNPALESAWMNGQQARPGAVKMWWLAVRPFSLPASTMPVIFGSVLAWTQGGAALDLPGFLAAFVGMALLHCGANLLNDVYDHRQGLDRRVHPASGAVVRGWISHRQALAAGWGMLAAGCALGGLLVATAGLAILWIGIIGVALGVFYTWGPFELKFHGLGDLAVFSAFAVLGATGAWTVQTGSVAWLPALWSIPLGLLIAAILHANNWRDMASDTAGGIRTMASLFGDRGSVIYYGLLLFTPFAFVVGWTVAGQLLALTPRMPWTMLIVLLGLPQALRLFGRALARHRPESPTDFVALDGATGQLNLTFGLLYTGALGLDALIRGLAA